MNSGIIFGAILILIIVILVWPTAGVAAKKEGFRAQGPPEKPAPLPAAAPEETLGSTMPAAPYIGANSQSPRPYTDPALTKASLLQLTTLNEDLKGFIAYELPQLQERSDPAIQLPLQNIQADSRRISDEVAVLARNPGQESQLTLQDVESIRANLSYLQRKNRVLVGAGLIEEKVTEGFTVNSDGMLAGVNFKIYDYGTTIPSSTFITIATALQAQAREVATKYNISKNYTVTYIGKDSNYSDLNNATQRTQFLLSRIETDIPILILSSVPGNTSAYGFHSLTYNNQNKIVSFIYIDMSKINNNNNRLTKTISHEIIETIGDPYTNDYSLNTLNNIMYSKELCDPVQETAYVNEINGIALSDYVFPSWFVNDSTGPYHKFGEVYKDSTDATKTAQIITAPFQIIPLKGWAPGRYNGKEGKIYGLGANADVNKFKLTDRNVAVDITPITSDNIDAFKRAVSNISPISDSDAANLVALNKYFDSVKAGTVPSHRIISKNILDETLADLRASAAAANRGSGTSGGSGSGNTKVTATDIENLIRRLQAEIARLSASGTSDEVVNARIATLQKIKLDLQKYKTMDPIPLTKVELDNLLVYVQDPNSPGAQFLNDNNMPSWLKYFIPNGDQNDEMVQKLLDGLSWSVSLDYTSKNKADAAGGGGKCSSGSGSDSSRNDSIFPDVKLNLDGITNTNNIDNINPYNYNDSNGAGRFGAGAGGAAGSFDWKERTQRICEQIKKSGFEPGDFGCLPADAVGKDFNWRGQAKRVCTRAATHADPGFPESLGCPPSDWAGWSK